MHIKNTIVGFKAVGLQTPPIIENIVKALRYLITGVMLLISGTDQLFTDPHHKVLAIFWLGVSTYIIEAIGLCFGIQPPEHNNNEIKKN